MSIRTLSLGTGALLLLLLASAGVLPVGQPPPIAEMANMADALSFSWPSSSSSAELVSIEEANQAYSNFLSEIDGMIFSSDAGIKQETIAGAVPGVAGASYSVTYKFDPSRCRFEGSGVFHFLSKSPIHFFIDLSSCNVGDFVEEFMNEMKKMVKFFTEAEIPFSSYWRASNQMISATIGWVATLLPEPHGEVLLEQFKLFFALGEIWFGQFMG